MKTRHGVVINLAVVSLVALLSEMSYGQAPPSVANACTADRQTYCADQKEPAKILECLADHSSQLQTSCKQEIDRFAAARKESSSHGGGALTSFGGPNAFGAPIPLFTYDGRLIPDSGHGTKQTENKVSLSAPVYHSGSDVYAVSLTAGQVDLGTTPLLSSGKAIPHTLDRMEAGVQVMEKLKDNGNWGLRASAGYAGDDPSATKDLSFSFAANYGFPSSGSGHWMVLVFIANNSPLANYVPIPGFGYSIKTDTFAGTFGFPITAMQWTPVNPWTFSLSIFGAAPQVEAAYGHINKFQTFVGYGVIQQTYIPSVRDDDRDRLTLQEEKAGVGFRVPIGKRMLTELQVGHSDGRTIYVGKGLFNKRGGAADLPANYYASWAVKVAF